MAEEILLTEKQGRCAVIRFNRPDKLNALSGEVLTALSGALEEFEQDAEVRVILLTGQGKAFVAGADIAAMREMNAQQAAAFAKKGQECFYKIESLTKPVIAVVNGFCLGGGNELAMACDLRLASEKAKFGQPEVNLGIPPGFGGTLRLPRLVGLGKARELILTGEMIDAAEAHRIGLVNQVHPEEQLWEKALALANVLVEKGPAALNGVKLILTENWGMNADDAHRLEAEAFGACFETGEAREGMGAFLEKRKPNWAQGQS